MIKIESFTVENNKLAELAFSIRTEVFVNEQNVPHELEYDSSDKFARHYLLYFNDKPVATARWRITDEGIKFERYAVLPEYRNKGLGSELVKHALKDTLNLGKKVYLHSQINAVRFYERHGFVKVGEKFTEAGIQHYKMVYETNYKL